MRKVETPEGRSVRLLRVGEQVRHVLSELLQRGDVHDDTLQNHLVSVTEVRMSPDLRHATVFVKPLLGEDEDIVLKALRTNTAFFQKEVARRMTTKYAAKIKFLADESFDEGGKIDALLRNPKVARDIGREMNLDDPMTGDGCRGERLTEAHREQLRAACAEDPDIWAIYYISYAPEHFDASFNALLERPWVPFALFDGDQFVGMSCFLNVDDSRQTLEIGSTFYRPASRATGFNRRCKDMMMRHAFDRGYRRIEFRVDGRNARSQAAMKRLGAVREGVMRADRITWNGHVRDTVLFAILRDEWPV